MKRDNEPALIKEAQEPTIAASRNSGSLDEAIKAVYKRYGTDLPAFFRDAYKEAARKHSKPVEDGVEAIQL